MQALEKEPQYAEIVKLFALVLNRYRLYPEKHPAAQLSIRNFFSGLETPLQTEPSLTFGFVEGRLLINDQSIDNKKVGAAELVRECKRLQIEGLTFERGIAEAEVSSFFKLMAAPPKVLEELGGFRPAFEQAGFEHIRLGTTLFKLVKLGEEVVQRGEVSAVGEGKGGEGALADRARKVERMEEVVEHCLKGSEGEIAIDAERLSFELEKKTDEVARQMLVRAENPEALRRIVRGMAGFLERRLAQPYLQEGKDFSAPISRLAKEFRKAVLSPEVPDHVRESGEELDTVLEQAADAIKLELVVGAFRESGGDGKALSKIATKFLRSKDAREKLVGPLRERLLNQGIGEEEFEQALAGVGEKRAPKKTRQVDVSPEELEELLRLRERFEEELAQRVEPKAIRLDEEKRRLLDEIGTAMQAASEPRAAVAALLNKVEAFSPQGAASTVRVINRETSDFEALACRNLNGGKPNGWQSAHSLARAVVNTGAPIVIQDLLTDGRAKDADFVRKYGLVSYLGVPLVAKKDVGVLEFFTKEEHQFSHEEIGLLATVADQAATALHDTQVTEGMNRLADELARSNRVREEFLGIMSHELRTPLSAIIGYAEMIKEKMLGELNSRQEEALDKVMCRSSDLLRMINSILEATSIESGGVELECREVNLKSLLDELKALYEMPLEKAITFVWDTPAEPVIIKTDFVKVKHILQNLINNAIEFTEKGQVTIAIRYLPESKNVQFKVSDTGNGIPPESLSTVFELFRQGDSSGARSHGGVGLGLYIVKKYTEVLGGAVEVETEPGKGSTFTVTIPSGMAAH